MSMPATLGDITGLAKELLAISFEDSETASGLLYRNSILFNIQGGNRWLAIQQYHELAQHEEKAVLTPRTQT